MAVESIASGSRPSLNKENTVKCETERTDNDENWTNTLFGVLTYTDMRFLGNVGKQ